MGCKRDCEMKGEMEGGRKGRSVVGKMRLTEGGSAHISGIGMLLGMEVDRRNSNERICNICNNRREQDLNEI